jgi:hypothetical protein
MLSKILLCTNVCNLVIIVSVVVYTNGALTSAGGAGPQSESESESHTTNAHNRFRTAALQLKSGTDSTIPLVQALKYYELVAPKLISKDGSTISFSTLQSAATEAMQHPGRRRGTAHQHHHPDLMTVTMNGFGKVCLTVSVYV